MDLAKVRDQVEILRYIKDQQAKLKVLADEAKSAIQAVMGAAELGELDGEPVVRWSSYEQTRLDQKRFKDAYPNAFQACTTTSVVRRFETL